MLPITVLHGARRAPRLTLHDATAPMRRGREALLLVAWAIQPHVGVRPPSLSTSACTRASSTGSCMDLVGMQPLSGQAMHWGKPASRGYALTRICTVSWQRLCWPRACDGAMGRSTSTRRMAPASYGCDEGGLSPLRTSGVLAGTKGLLAGTKGVLLAGTKVLTGWWRGGCLREEVDRVCHDNDGRVVSERATRYSGYPGRGLRRRTRVAGGEDRVRRNTAPSGVDGLWAYPANKISTRFAPNSSVSCAASFPFPNFSSYLRARAALWNSPARPLPNARSKEGGGWGPEGRGSEADVEIILSRRSSGVLMLLLRSCMRRRVAC